MMRQQSKLFAIHKLSNFLQTFFAIPLYIYIYNIYNTYSHPILQGFPKKKPLVTKRHPHFGEKSSRSPTMRTSKWAKLRRLRRCEVWGGLPGCNPVATYRSCWVVLKQKYVKNQYECWKTRGGKPVVITCSRFVITGSYGWVWLVCLEGFGNVSSNIYIYILKQIHVTFFLYVLDLQYYYICMWSMIYTHLHNAFGCQMKDVKPSLEAASLASPASCQHVFPAENKLPATSRFH